MVNFKAYQYSKELLKVAETKASFGPDKEESEQKKKVRDQGFRKAIIALYSHRCALCGIRMLTPEGHTIVDAAHVKPWKDSFDDRPTNGMALCKLCHWSFDKGLMSVGKKYEVLVSKRVMKEQNYPGHILTLTDRPIFTPEKESFWPVQDNLHWHRNKIFVR
jgi:putative restriction endonuclease